MRTAQAKAERRHADAIARQQEMKVNVAASRVMVVLAQAKMPAALATAFRAGQFRVGRGPLAIDDTPYSERGVRPSTGAFGLLLINDSESTRLVVGFRDRKETWQSIDIGFSRCMSCVMKPPTAHQSRLA